MIDQWTKSDSEDLREILRDPLVGDAAIEIGRVCRLAAPKLLDHVEALELKIISSDEHAMAWGKLAREFQVKAENLEADNARLRKVVEAARESYKAGCGSCFYETSIDEDDENYQRGNNADEASKKLGEALSALEGEGGK